MSFLITVINERYIRLYITSRLVGTVLDEMRMIAIDLFLRKNGNLQRRDACFREAIDQIIFV